MKTIKKSVVADLEDRQARVSEAIDGAHILVDALISAETCETEADFVASVEEALQNLAEGSQGARRHQGGDVTMSKVSVERVAGRKFEIDVKRLSLPFRVTATCPSCGRETVSDLAGQDHLSYPSLGVPEELCFCCPDGEGYDGCGHDWTEKLVLDVTLVPAVPQVSSAEVCRRQITRLELEWEEAVANVRRLERELAAVRERYVVEFEREERGET